MAKEDKSIKAEEKKAAEEVDKSEEVNKEQVDQKNLDLLIEKAAKAQQEFANFTQEQVDRIFYEAAMAANKVRIPLAKMAVEETGMGIVEDKVIKNHFASEYIYNKFCDEKTCGVIYEDKAYGLQKVAEPLGVIAGVVPTTNPTSTAIFKALIALKTRNAIVFSPHPRAKRCTAEACRIVSKAAVQAGAPDGLILCIEEPTVPLSAYLMKHPKIALILATGGPGMVRAAYSAGKPALGVGAGNTPAVIDEFSDYKMAVSSILLSKTFDNGVVCASEQNAVIVKDIYDATCKEFEDRGAFFVRNPKDIAKLRECIFPNGALNAKVVGQKATTIAQLAGIQCDPKAKMLIVELDKIGDEELLSHEKLSPVLGIHKAENFDDAIDKADKLVRAGGIGHTATLFTDPRQVERIAKFEDVLKTGRLLINSPASQGAIGDLYNFMLYPSLTLGCGSWGGNSSSENISVKNLLNIKTVAEKRENMLWFKVPPKIYFKYGCLPTALGDLKGRKRAIVITDRPLYDLGFADIVTDELAKLGMHFEVYKDVRPDPDIDTIRDGLRILNSFKPDVVIALGGGSPMDAAKIMWLMYEHPDIDFDNMAMRFMDIRKRIYKFPETEKKSLLVAIPTTSGTGSEVTPFAVVTDNASGKKYPITDYVLTPYMAIIDSMLCMKMPRSLTAASGIDAVTHSLEALASCMSTEYTDGLALEALRLIFTWLPVAYNEPSNVEAREHMHNAATLAGIAFANAFLGVCHSMAHKLGSRYHVVHGIANAMLISQVVRYNSNDRPVKMATFPQYKYPKAKLAYARVADHLGLGGADPDEKVDRLIDAIQNLKKQINIPMSIKEHPGMDEKVFFDTLDDLAEEAFDDQCTGCNPRYPLISEIKQLLAYAWKGDIPPKDF